MRVFAFLALLVSCAAHGGWEDRFAGLWWNPAQSGWGVSLQHQDTHVSATLLVYDPAGHAIWFLAPSLELPATTSAVPVSFSGELFEPVEEGPGRKVGSISFTLAADAGTVEYVIDGTVTRSVIVRALFAPTAISGHFAGARNVSWTGSCGNAEYTETNVEFDVVRDRDRASLLIHDAEQACFSTGTYVDGWAGSIAGSFSCSGYEIIPSGTLRATGIRADRNAIGFSYVMTDDACTMSATVNAARVASAADNGAPLHDLSGVWNLEGASLLLHHQGETIFGIVRMVGDERPFWYVAPNMAHVDGQDGAVVTYRGTLASVDGSPYTRPPYDAAAFRATPTGSLEVRLDPEYGIGSATVIFDGQQQAGGLTRASWPRAASIAGNYATTRLDELGNGSPTYGSLSIAQDANQVRLSLWEWDSGVTCEAVGGLLWTGLLGALEGQASCSGRTGAPTQIPFFADGVRLTGSGISMRFCLGIPATCSSLAGLPY